MLAAVYVRIPTDPTRPHEVVPVPTPPLLCHIPRPPG